MPKAVVVVPTYNERDNVRPLIERISAVRRSVREVEIEVLFVDDSSPDGTGEEVKQAMGQYEFVHLLTRPKKEGIGRAFLDGFRFALDRFSPTVVVQMDGDLASSLQVHAPRRVAEAGKLGKPIARTSRPDRRELVPEVLRQRHLRVRAGAACTPGRVSRMTRAHLQRQRDGRERRGRIGYARKMCPLPAARADSRRAERGRCTKRPRRTPRGAAHS